MIQANVDAGAVCDAKECAEAVFESGKMVKAVGLDILEKRMEALDPTKGDSFKFIGFYAGTGVVKEKIWNQ